MGFFNDFRYTPLNIKNWKNTELHRLITEKHNNWVLLDDYSDWELYCRKVSHYTNISKRDIMKPEGDYQLDHKYSKYRGFKENRVKSTKCSIDLDKLIGDLYGQ
jgi:hypothetical protein